MAIIESLSRPEYTGENRCLPCTAVNTVIALGMSVLVGTGLIWVQTTPAVALTMTGFLFTLSLSVIWLRGYLIPGTPSLTKRYMPQWLLAWLGKDIQRSTIGNQTGIDPEITLLQADVLAPCSEVDDLCLTDAFDRAWMAELETGSDNPDPLILVEQLGLEPEDVTIEQYDDAVVVNRDGNEIGQWPSATAMRLDLAAAVPLAEWTPEWDTLSPIARSQLLAGVRIFVPGCPENDTVEFSSQTVESCCSSYEVVTATCVDSGDRLLEQPVQQAR